MMHELKPAPTDTQKFCKDCRYIHKPLLTKFGISKEILCSYMHVNFPIQDRVTGNLINQYHEAKSMRSYGTCGIEAKWFESKD